MPLPITTTSLALSIPGDHLSRLPIVVADSIAKSPDRGTHGQDRPDARRTGLVSRLPRLGVEDGVGQSVGGTVVHGQEEIPWRNGRRDERTDACPAPA